MKIPVKEGGYAAFECDSKKSIKFYVKKRSRKDGSGDVLLYTLAKSQKKQDGTWDVRYTDFFDSDLIALKSFIDEVLEGSKEPSPKKGTTKNVLDTPPNDDIPF